MSLKQNPVRRKNTNKNQRNDSESSSGVTEEIIKVRESDTLLNKEKINRILERIQYQALTFLVEDEKKLRIKKCTSIYKRRVNNFEIKTKDPKKIYKGFWDLWEGLTEILRELILPEDFNYIKKHSKGELSKIIQYCKKAEAMIPNLRQNMKETFLNYRMELRELNSQIEEIEQPEQFTYIEKVLIRARKFLRENIFSGVKNLKKDSPAILYLNSCRQSLTNVINMTKVFLQNSQSCSDFWEVYGQSAKQLRNLVPQKLNFVVIIPDPKPEIVKEPTVKTESTTKFKPYKKNPINYTPRVKLVDRIPDSIAPTKRKRRQGKPSDMKSFATFQSIADRESSKKRSQSISRPKRDKSSLGSTAQRSFSPPRNIRQIRHQESKISYQQIESDSEKEIILPSKIKNIDSFESFERNKQPKRKQKPIKRKEPSRSVSESESDSEKRNPKKLSTSSSIEPIIRGPHKEEKGFPPKPAATEPRIEYKPETKESPKREAKVKFNEQELKESLKAANERKEKAERKKAMLERQKQKQQTPATEKKEEEKEKPKPWRNAMFKMVFSSSSSSDNEKESPIKSPSKSDKIENSQNQPEPKEESQQTPNEVLVSSSSSDDDLKPLPKKKEDPLPSSSSSSSSVTPTSSDKEPPKSTDSWGRPTTWSADSSSSPEASGAAEPLIETPKETGRESSFAQEKREEEAPVKIVVIEPHMSDYTTSDDTPESDNPMPIPPSKDSSSSSDGERDILNMSSSSVSESESVNSKKEERENSDIEKKAPTSSSESGDDSDDNDSSIEKEETPPNKTISETSERSEGERDNEYISQQKSVLDSDSNSTEHSEQEAPRKESTLDSSNSSSSVSQEKENNSFEKSPTGDKDESAHQQKSVLDSSTSDDEEDGESARIEENKSKGSIIDSTSESDEDKFRARIRSPSTSSGQEIEQPPTQKEEISFTTSSSSESEEIIKPAPKKLSSTSSSPVSDDDDFPSPKQVDEETVEVMESETSESESESEKATETGGKQDEPARKIDSSSSSESYNKDRNDDDENDDDDDVNNDSDDDSDNAKNSNGNESESESEKKQIKFEDETILDSPDDSPSQPRQPTPLSSSSSSSPIPAHNKDPSVSSDSESTNEVQQKVAQPPSSSDSSDALPAPKTKDPTEDDDDSDSSESDGLPPPRRSFISDDTDSDSDDIIRPKMIKKESESSSNSSESDDTPPVVAPSSSSSSSHSKIKEESEDYSDHSLLNPKVQEEVLSLSEQIPVEKESDASTEDDDDDSDDDQKLDANKIQMTDTSEDEDSIFKPMKKKRLSSSSSASSSSSEGKKPTPNRPSRFGSPSDDESDDDDDDDSGSFEIKKGTVNKSILDSSDDDDSDDFEAQKKSPVRKSVLDDSSDSDSEDDSIPRPKPIVSSSSSDSDDPPVIKRPRPSAFDSYAESSDYSDPPKKEKASSTEEGESADEVKPPSSPALGSSSTAVEKSKENDKMMSSPSESSDKSLLESKNAITPKLQPSKFTLDTESDEDDFGIQKKKTIEIEDSSASSESEVPFDDSKIVHQTPPPADDSSSTSSSSSTSQRKVLMRRHSAFDSDSEPSPMMIQTAPPISDSESVSFQRHRSKLIEVSDSESDSFTGPKNRMSDSSDSPQLNQYESLSVLPTLVVEKNQSALNSRVGSRIGFGDNNGLPHSDIPSSDSDTESTSRRRTPPSSSSSRSKPKSKHFKDNDSDSKMRKKERRRRAFGTSTSSDDSDGSRSDSDDIDSLRREVERLRQMKAEAIEEFYSIKTEDDLVEEGTLYRDEYLSIEALKAHIMNEMQRASAFALADKPEERLIKEDNEVLASEVSELEEALSKAEKELEALRASASDKNDIFGEAQAVNVASRFAQWKLSNSKTYLEKISNGDDLTEQISSKMESLKPMAEALGRDIEAEISLKTRTNESLRITKETRRKTKKHNEPNTGDKYRRAATAYMSWLGSLNIDEVQMTLRHAFDDFERSLFNTNSFKPAEVENELGSTLNGLMRETGHVRSIIADIEKQINDLGVTLKMKGTTSEIIDNISEMISREKEEEIVIKNADELDKDLLMENERLRRRLKSLK